MAERREAVATIRPEHMPPNVQLGSYILEDVRRIPGEVHAGRSCDRIDRRSLHRLSLRVVAVIPH